MLRVDDVEPMRVDPVAEISSDRSLERHVVEEGVLSDRDRFDREAVIEVLFDRTTVVGGRTLAPERRQHREIDPTRETSEKLDAVGSHPPLVRKELGSEETDSRRHEGPEEFEGSP